jgi:hypothetical protein
VASAPPVDGDLRARHFAGDELRSFLSAADAADRGGQLTLDGVDIGRVGPTPVDDLPSEVFVPARLELIGIPREAEAPLDV